MNESLKLPSGKSIQELLDSLPKDINESNVCVDQSDFRFIAENLLKLIAQEPYTYVREVHEGWPEYNKSNEFSDGKSAGTPLFTNKSLGRKMVIDPKLENPSNKYTPGLI